MSIKLIFISIFALCISFNENEVPVGCLKLDVMILADRSSSVGGKEQFIHDAVYTFIDKFELSEDGIKIGLITFGDLARLESHLSYYKDSLKMATNIISPYSANGSTNLSEALIMATQELVINGRQGVMKIVILITDGEPSNKDTAAEHATFLKSMPGTLIWGIFVKKMEIDITSPYMPNFVSPYIANYGADYLKSISSPNCFIESDYNNLVEQVKKLDICL
jgi:uncharacterized protein YegL